MGGFAAVFAHRAIRLFHSALAVASRNARAKQGTCSNRHLLSTKRARVALGNASHFASVDARQVVESQGDWLRSATICLNPLAAFRETFLWRVGREKLPLALPAFLAQGVRFVSNELTPRHGITCKFALKPVKSQLTRLATSPGAKSTSQSQSPSQLGITTAAVQVPKTPK